MWNRQIMCMPIVLHFSEITRLTAEEKTWRTGYMSIYTQKWHITTWDQQWTSTDYYHHCLLLEALILGTRSPLNFYDNSNKHCTNCIKAAQTWLAILNFTDIKYFSKPFHFFAEVAICSVIAWCWKNSIVFFWEVLGMQCVFLWQMLQARMSVEIDCKTVCGIYSVLIVAWNFLSLVTSFPQWQPWIFPQVGFCSPAESNCRPTISPVDARYSMCSISRNTESW